MATRYQPTPGGEYSASAPQATPAQKAYLLKLGAGDRFGHLPPMTKAQASARIDILLKRSGR